MTTVRILNDAGLQRFKEYIAAVKTAPKLEPPREILEDGKFSEPFTPSLEVELQQFENAYDFGVYLNTVFADCEPREISRNHALWSWFALFFFDVIAKSNTSGARKILEEAVYVLDKRFSFQRYYRHLVRTPWLAVYKHGEVAKVLLIAAAGGTRTEVGEQLGAYPDLFGSENIIAAAYRMYFDVDAQKPKRGTSGKLGGTPRRLTAVVRQLQLTYDLNDCPVDEFLGLLPREFSKWLPSA
ncbi:hypothetical protein [Rhodanobacter sp. C03]|uniref:hypothetical protein n=1 Tax=Rhodanobacter sp. C03 TaxID=1945858 RepID=UPI000986D16F|nr:hypothetical protein [Rhodanobacter sp. C03]OOG58374.1 hypothetical protein B0E48_06195 [Rhodanobacter sp. C03]